MEPTSPTIVVDYWIFLAACVVTAVSWFVLLVLVICLWLRQRSTERMLLRFMGISINLKSAWSRLCPTAAPFTNIPRPQSVYLDDSREPRRTVNDLY